MTVEDAIKVSIEYVKKLFGGSDHRLEEVSLLDAGDFVVTVSFRTPEGSRLVPLARDSGAELSPGRKAAIGLDASRTYKDVFVSKDGHVKRVSMRHIVVG